MLEAIRQGTDYGALSDKHPSKVVIAAFERELHAGRIDYGTSITSPWLTDKGRAWLECNTANEHTEKHTQTHRKSSYAAVYAYIHHIGDYMPPDPAHRNLVAAMTSRE